MLSLATLLFCGYGSRSEGGDLEPAAVVLSQTGILQQQALQGLLGAFESSHLVILMIAP